MAPRPTPIRSVLQVFALDCPDPPALAEDAGARRHPVQPAEDGSWAVFTDPAGHLFCLCQA